MRHLRSAALLSVIAGVAAIGGCGLFTADDDYCTAEAAPAILLEIVDIATNVSPLVPSRITVTDGQFVERYPPAGGTGRRVVDSMNEGGCMSDDTRGQLSRRNLLRGAGAALAAAAAGLVRLEHRGPHGRVPRENSEDHGSAPAVTLDLLDPSKRLVIAHRR